MSHTHGKSRFAGGDDDCFASSSCFGFWDRFMTRCNNNDGVENTGKITAAAVAHRFFSNNHSEKFGQYFVQSIFNLFAFTYQNFFFF